MKKFLLASLLALLAFSVYAQDNNQRRQGARPRRGGEMRTRFTPEQLAKMEVDAINEAVGLDSLQYQLIYILKYSDVMAMQEKMKENSQTRRKKQKDGSQSQAFDAKSREEMKKAREEMMKAREEVMKSRREAMNEELKQILSPKQYKKYLKYEEKKQKERRKMGESRKRNKK